MLSNNLLRPKNPKNLSSSVNTICDPKPPGRILLSLMSSSTLNAHDLSHYESPVSGSWFDGTVREIGQAFNPTLALVNHSCNPNSIHYNFTRASVSVALRNIAKGEEVKSDKG
jgi:hypothetical protein